MNYQCIGQIRDNHGNLSRCSHTSCTPTYPDKPNWGYLCPWCANRPPERFSRVYNGLPDVDAPDPRNEPSETAGAGDGYPGLTFK